MMAFLGLMEIIESETIYLHEVHSKITIADYSRTEVNTCKEIHLLSDTMFAPFAVSEDSMNSNVM